MNRVVNRNAIILGLLGMLFFGALALACDVDNPPRLFGAAAKSLQPTVLSPGHSLKLVVQNGYLPQSPVLVRFEVLDAKGERDWALWEAEATLSTDQPGVTLSTNRFIVRNGMGSVLVGINGTSDFKLVATIAGVQTNRTLQSLATVPMTRMGGILAGASSTWSGVMLITNDVTIPVGHTLTIASNTLVLVNGASTGTTAPRILVNGTINSLGEEGYPVTITTTNMLLNWGQIRHTSAQPSLYRYTTICKAGRATGEGHTGTGPMVRLNGSTVVFESCNISDAVANLITNGIGKIMMADNSGLTFNNCLLTRARSGPEIATTSLLCTNSYLMEMYGADDADGIYLHDAGAQVLKIRRCVIAVGDDDAIDTLGSIVQVDNCIIRDFCDKGLSILDGKLFLDKSLVVDENNGISVKSQSSNVTIPVSVNDTTISVATNGIATINKYGGQTNVNGIYNVTNTIVRAAWSVVTDYEPTNFHLRYCNVSPSFSGPGNTPANNSALAAIVLAGPGMTTNLPLFLDQPAGDYRLSVGSPCIDAGDPASPLDPDGSRADVGYLRFQPPQPILGGPQSWNGSTYQFAISGYPNRNYVIERSETLTNWTVLKTVFLNSSSGTVTDPTATNTLGVYRAHLAP